MKLHFKIRTLVAIIIPVGLLIFLAQCKTDEQGEENSDTLIEDTLAEHSPSKEIFYAMPSPTDIASLLVDDTGMEFNEDLLNDPKNAEKYNTDVSRAINLGIYTADLSYASYFEQTQISRNYFTVTKNMSEELGISNSVSKKHIKMISESKLDKEKMERILNETFMNTDAYLLENNRQDVMTAILYGGWIEALYFATGDTGGDPDKKPELTMRITDQTILLELLDRLFKQSKDENIKALQSDLNKIKESYTIINKNMNPENFEAFCGVVKELRTKYTN